MKTHYFQKFISSNNVGLEWMTKLEIIQQKNEIMSHFHSPTNLNHPIASAMLCPSLREAAS